MTPQQRYDEIAAREQAATPGEWRVREYPDCFPLIKLPNDEIQDISRREDADFIAHARADIPYLLARIRHAEELMRHSQAWWDDDFMDAAPRLREEWDAFLAGDPPTTV